MLILFFVFFLLSWYTLLYMLSRLSYHCPFLVFLNFRAQRPVKTQFRLQSNIEISRIDFGGILDGNGDLQVDLKLYTA